MCNDIIILINCKGMEKLNNKFKNLPPYSIYMSVYKGEKSEYLKESMESMFNQTYPADEFVLICDGPLTKELDEVISHYKSKYPNTLNVIRLDKNIGTGQCANMGIDICKNEYIVKMDSDDIALSERCEKQMRLMQSNPNLTMCGGYIREFDTNTQETIAIKKTPSKNSEIRQFARRRNPFNNQTLVFKKSMAKAIGGYSSIKRCEDYDFVVNMLRNGAIGENIPEVLVDYRVNKDNYARRQNWANTKSFINVRWRIFRSGYSNIIDFIVPCAMQMMIFILPKKLTAKIYKKFLR